jgi:hypothetical protein
MGGTREGGGDVITKKGGRGSPMHRHKPILAEKVRNLKYGCLGLL